MAITELDDVEIYNFPGIYQIMNLYNGKRYIGQAINCARRFREHKRLLLALSK